MRPIAAVSAGYFGDRFKHSLIIKWLFALVILGSLTLASGWLIRVSYLAVALNIAALSLGIYGLRGLYYALLQEAQIPMSLTGSAVGFISVVGYTPDVFMGLLMGWILDSHPVKLGHQYLFASLALFAFLGLATTLLFAKTTEKTL
jgi:MFS family permease